MTNINFDEPSKGNVSSNDSVALEIQCTGTTNAGILVESLDGDGIYGIAKAVGKWTGIIGMGHTGVRGISNRGGSPAVVGEGSVGVTGTALDFGPGFKQIGVLGTGNVGVSGEGKFTGVSGKSTEPGRPGVSGEGHVGVMGTSTAEGAMAVYGNFTGKTGISVLGWSNNPEGSAVGVEGRSTNWIGVLGRGKIAGRFEGDVEITGELRVTKDIMLMNADCAEEFDIVEENVEPGTVMVLNEMGSLEPSYQEYDKKVAGIISGASGYNPAIVLDRQNQNENEENMYKKRRPIALMGKTYCKVDARNSSIEIGDLLTTSSTKGYAMKANDPTKAFGAVIGKALGLIKEGLGIIPVLVTLQ